MLVHRELFNYTEINFCVATPMSFSKEEMFMIHGAIRNSIKSSPQSMLVFFFLILIAPLVGVYNNCLYVASAVPLYVSPALTLQNTSGWISSGFASFIALGFPVWCCANRPRRTCLSPL